LFNEGDEMKRALLIGFCSVVLLSACQRTETTAVTDTSTTLATDTSGSLATETSATPTAPYDLQFIDSLIRHHQMAVDMATMAAPKFEHQPLKDAAKTIVDDQTKEIAQLRQWRGQWYSGAAPAENMQLPGMSSMSMDMSHMQSMSGHALDMMFIDMMIPHHEGGLAMGQDALAKAEHPEIKELAQKMIEKQKKEIEQMQQWKKDWAK
jgi:uncharacterized protein (DUF305 family)